MPPLPDAPAGFRTFAFVLAVPDMEAAAAYFRDALGFAVLWPEATDWRLVSRGEVRIMVGHCPGTPPARDTGAHSYFGYVHVADIDALHAEYASSGAIILQAPHDTAWGLREMLVATPDGHRLMFGQERGTGR